MSSSPPIAIAGDDCMRVTCRADGADRRDRRAGDLIVGSWGRDGKADVEKESVIPLLRLSETAYLEVMHKE